MKKYPLILFLFGILAAHGQEIANPRPLTLAEYEKAKSFNIQNLDQDTYVKFENTYILDRYEMRKPYFITGDDNLKKRIDLYKLVAREGLQELGIMLFYTNETGKIYKAVLPNFTADATVWNRYFEDIHAIDKMENNFVLKVSYILSKEVSFQVYKSINQGKDLASESGTYGNDICFPGDQMVAMKNGSLKKLSDIKPFDVIATVDPATRKTSFVNVRKLVSHEAKAYVLVSLTLVHATEIGSPSGLEIELSSKVVEATPNHPMRTDAGDKEIGKVAIGEKILCDTNTTGGFDFYTVIRKQEYVRGKQRVFNIEADGGSTFLMNGIMVKQK